MASAELKRKLFFFIVVVAAASVLLVVLPQVESWVLTAVYAYFGVVAGPDGQFVSTSGGGSGQSAGLIVGLVEHLFHIFRIIIWMTVVISIVRVVTYLIFGAALKKSGQYEISSILKTVLSVVTYIVAFFIIFQTQYPNVALAPLFTGSTILGIVVGLALQDTLGNLFAGIAIQADQPFQVGDVVSITKGVGVVEMVSWRGVKIRTFQNKLLVISNSVLGKEVIEVAPKDNLNARLVNFNTTYSVSPAKTIHVIREVVQRVENVSPKMRPVVRIRNLGDNGLDYEVKYWLEDYTRHHDTDALIRQRIWYAFQRENIHFAFPTRTVYMEDRPLEPEFTDSVNEIYERLNDVPIFAPLSDEETQKIAETVSAKIYSPDEPIIKRGQEGNSMFVIHRGAVKIQVRENGVAKIVRTLGEGDFFGEMGLFTGQPRTATVIATEETEILEITHDALKPILEDNPDLVERFGDIIEQRRLALAEIKDKSAPEIEMDKAGIFSSIRKFFGLGE